MVAFLGDTNNFLRLLVIACMVIIHNRILVEIVIWGIDDIMNS